VELGAPQCKLCVRELEPVDLGDRPASGPVDNRMSFGMKLVDSLYALRVRNGIVVVARLALVLGKVVTNSLIYVYENQHGIIIFRG